MPATRLSSRAAESTRSPSGCFQALVDQPLQRRAMQLNHGLNQLQRGGPNFRVAGLI